MIGKNYAALFGLGLLLAGSGCVSCGHDVCKPALEAGPYSEAPTCDRRHVYAFLINGLTPCGPSGLDGLRLKLAERGFEKVYRGEVCHTVWMGREMKRVRNCDPEARFVIVGYGFGCGSAAGLARDAARDGFPVDAVVFLDPTGVKECRDAGQTMVIRSGIESPAELDSKGVCVSTGGHFTLPTHERTVGAIAALMSESAARIEHPLIVNESFLLYEDAPPPRVTPTVAPNTPEEWLFLHDRLGPHGSPLSPLP